jgi:hypothetical protein
MALGRRQAVLLAVALTVLAFAIAFVVARAVAGDSDSTAPGPAEPLPAQPVTIDNLERAPTIKPLRSIAGEPEPAAGSTTPPAGAATP